MPRTGLEPARLAALAPETSASTIPPPGHQLGFVATKLVLFVELSQSFVIFLFLGERDSGKGRAQSGEEAAGQGRDGAGREKVIRVF